MGGTDVSGLLGEKVKATGRLDDNIETGLNSVSLSQEVAVLQQLVLRNVGE